jgi:hypothetical protein
MVLNKFNLKVNLAFFYVELYRILYDIEKQQLVVLPLSSVDKGWIPLDLADLRGYAQCLDLEQKWLQNFFQDRLGLADTLGVHHVDPLANTHLQELVLDVVLKEKGGKHLLLIKQDAFIYELLHVFEVLAVVVVVATH